MFKFISYMVHFLFLVQPSAIQYDNTMNNIGQPTPVPIVHQNEPKCTNRTIRARRNCPGVCGAAFVALFICFFAKMFTLYSNRELEIKLSLKLDENMDKYRDNQIMGDILIQDLSGNKIEAGFISDEYFGMNEVSPIYRFNQNKPSGV